ncbi:23S rRNA (uracil-C(5))-methyltransferase RlmCD [Candidatus Rubidus massiliensis]|nr:23S rRNA (uracil-C(5))-methyltransferase RlmCD [Candidatus Rubidus massiliensis]
MNKFSQKKLCSHFPHCPSCQMQQIEESALYQKALNFFAKQKIKYEYTEGQGTGWRRRAKLAVRWQKKALCIGLYEPGTHKVINIDNCAAHDPLINSAIKLFKAWVSEEGLQAYDEDKRTGLIKYIQLEVERMTQTVRLTIVLHADQIDESFKTKIIRLYEKESIWHSIWINCNLTITNTIFGKKWELICGKKFLWENYDNLKVAFLPSNFMQANAEMYACLLEDIYNQLTQKTNVEEFYAGVGTIGLKIVEKANQVHCCELDDSSKASFEVAKNVLPLANQSKIEFVVASAKDIANRLLECETAIFDPPRKGLDKELLTQIAKSTTLKEIHYVSCGWDSFERDTYQLISLGWQIKFAKIYWFFPGTDHIETYVVFKKN